MKAVISYFIVLLSALVYMIFFDARSGSVMLFFLLITIFVSVFLTIKVKKRINVSFVTDEGTLKKKAKANAYINVVKDTFLPLPIVTVTLGHSAGIMDTEYTQYRFSMSEKKNLKIEFDFIPEFSGPAQISIDKVEIADYLGIFKLKLKNIRKIIREVYVSPDIPEIESNSELLKIILDSVTESDDDDAVTISSLPGLPGYEYREYVPGDSLKRINWKLSSKKNQLFVRLDETAGVNIPNIVLANCSSESSDRNELALSDRITESALALARICALSGVGCTLSYYEEDDVVTEEIFSTEDAYRVAENISHIYFKNQRFEIRKEEKKKSSEMNIIFAPEINGFISSYAEHLVSSGNMVRFVIPNDHVGNASSGNSDVWLVNDDYSIVRS